MNDMPPLDVRVNDLEMRMTKMDAQLEENQREHTETKQDLAKILGAVNDLKVAIYAEAARRGVLITIGSAVLAGFGWMLWQVFGSDVGQALHTYFRIGGKTP